MNIDLGYPTYRSIKSLNQSDLTAQINDALKKQSHIHGEKKSDLIAFFLKRVKPTKNLIVIALTKDRDHCFHHCYIGVAKKWRKKELKKFYIIDKLEEVHYTSGSEFGDECKEIMRQIAFTRIKKLEL